MEATADIKAGLPHPNMAQMQDMDKSRLALGCLLGPQQTLPNRNNPPIRLDNLLMVVQVQRPIQVGTIKAISKGLHLQDTNKVHQEDTKVHHLQDGSLDHLALVVIHKDNILLNNRLILLNSHLMEVTQVPVTKVEDMVISGFIPLSFIRCFDWRSSVSGEERKFHNTKYDVKAKSKYCTQNLY